MPSSSTLLTRASGVKPKSISVCLGFGAPPCLDVHRQAEFADERPARWLAAPNAPAEVLDVHVAALPARSNSKLVAVNNHAHGQAVDLWNGPGDARRPYRPRSSKQRCHH